MAIIAMMRRRYLLVGAASVVIGVIAWVLLSISDDIWIAYVVCADKRIYEVDVARGKLLRVSAPFAGIGGSPVDMQIAYGDGIVYVGSQMGKEAAFHPLLAIDAKREFEVIGIHRFGVPLDRAQIGSGWFGDVYSLTLAPSGRRLFVLLRKEYEGPAFTSAWPDDKGLAEVMVTGVESVIMPWYEISPDENSVTNIRPAGQQVGEDESGNIPRRVWKGSVSTRDISGGPWDRKELVANRGLHPPWGRITSPLVHVVPGYGGARIDLYDRDSGERLVEIDLSETLGAVGTWSSRDFGGYGLARTRCG